MRFLLCTEFCEAGLTLPKKYKQSLLKDEMLPVHPGQISLQEPPLRQTAPSCFWSLIFCFKKVDSLFFLNPQHYAVLCKVDAKRCEELLFSPQDHEVKVYRMLTSQMLPWFPRATEPANEVCRLWGKGVSSFSGFLFSRSPKSVSKLCSRSYVAWYLEFFCLDKQCEK